MLVATRPSWFEEQKIDFINMSTARIVIGLLLMGTSNGLAWHMVKSSSSSLPVLRSAVWKIALFYTLWALYNRYPGGRDGELGHFSFGLLTLVCIGTAHLRDEARRPSLTKIPLAAACGLVTLNFCLVIPLIFKAGGPFGLAKLIWNDDSTLVHAWSYGFTAYIVSNQILWSYCVYLFYSLSFNSGEDLGYTTPTIDTREYQPVETADV